jgi:hypothetical protein
LDDDSVNCIGSIGSCVPRSTNPHDCDWSLIDLIILSYQNDKSEKDDYMPFAGLQLQPAEFFETLVVPQAAGVIVPNELIPQKEIRKNKLIWGLSLDIRFHVQVVGAAGNASVLNSEFPLGFIDRIKVDGSSRKFGGVREFLNANFSTLFQFFALYPQVGTNGAFRFPQVLVSQAGATFVQQLGPNSGTDVRGATGKAIATSPTAGAVTSHYDVIIQAIIPLVPVGLQDPSQQAMFMLNGPDWEVLNLHVFTADQSGLFDVKANTTITFGAIQGTAIAGGTAAPTGNPLVQVSLIRPNLGSARNNPNLGNLLLHRTFQPLTTVLQSANLTDSLIARLSVQMKYLRHFIKVGVKPTDTPTNGVGSVINGLTDGIITRPKVKRAGIAIRNPINTASYKEWYAQSINVTIPNGYILTDFLDHGDANTYFPADKIKTKDDFTLEGDLTSAANQIGEILEERVLEAVPSQ